jgi:4'-phosphopantetheinyl transferase
MMLWCWDVDRPVDTSCLSAAERTRAARFRFERDRRRWEAAHAHVRGALGSYLGRVPASLEFVAGPNGKPALAGVEGVHFNLSHAGGRALLAVSDAGPVGVDLEPLHVVPQVLEVARHALTPAELRALAALPAGAVGRDGGPDARSLAFLRTWVVKEAVMKANGAGLSGQLASIAVRFAAGVATVAAERPGAPPVAPMVRLLAPAPGFVGAVAGFDRAEELPEHGRGEDRGDAVGVVARADLHHVGAGHG